MRADESRESWMCSVVAKHCTFMPNEEHSDLRQLVAAAAEVAPEHDRLHPRTVGRRCSRSVPAETTRSSASKFLTAV